MSERPPAPAGNEPPTPQQVKQEIRRLRSLLREILQAYQVRREAEIAALGSWLDELKTGDDGKEEQRQRRTIDEIASLLASLKMKPEKGRLKDIRRLHELIDEIHALRQRHED